MSLDIREFITGVYEEQIHRKPTRVANVKCCSYVVTCQPFKGANLYGKWEFPVIDTAHPHYVVYSYGEHYPMYIFDPVMSVWFENATGYRQTTAKHHSYAWPQVTTMKVGISIMESIVRYGVLYTYNKVTGENYEIIREDEGAINRFVLREKGEADRT